MEPRITDSRMPEFVSLIQNPQSKKNPKFKSKFESEDVRGASAGRNDKEVTHEP